MQPIIVLGVAAVAVALVGTGFLGEPWNQFTLFVQQLGWGEADVDSPISSATVDLEIKKTTNDNGTPVSECDPLKGQDNDPEPGETFEECEIRQRADDFFENTIKFCSFHSEDDIDEATGTQVSPGLLICKLTDDRGLAIAEGRLNFDKYDGSDKLFIEITMTAFDGANDVQAPIHDVKLIVTAPIGN